MRLFLVMCVALPALIVQGSQTRPRVDAWPWYHDEAHGLSFRYPSELRPLEAPVESLRGLSGWVHRVDLVPVSPSEDTWPVLSVNVFICGDPHLDPGVPCVNEGWYRGICDRFEKFRLGNADALQCVDYGRAACHWSAVVLRRKGSVRVSALAADRQANEDTVERAECAERVVARARRSYPTKEIMASFVFR